MAVVGKCYSTEPSLAEKAAVFIGDKIVEKEYDKTTDKSDSVADPTAVYPFTLHDTRFKWPSGAFG